MDSTYRSGGSFQSNDSIVSTLPVDGRYISLIYFFFVLDTDRLTDPSQLVNLDGIARIAKKHGAHVKSSVRQTVPPATTPSTTACLKDVPHTW